MNRRDPGTLPFAAGALAIVLVTLATTRLPEAFVAALDRRALLEGAEGRWAFRLLLMAAVAQAAYGGFVALRPERAASALRAAPSAAQNDVLGSAARTAALLIVLTLTYAVADLVATARQRDVWAFALVATGQWLWYRRSVAEMGRFLALQPAQPGPRGGPWRPGDEDYCPPLARGLVR